MNKKIFTVLLIAAASFVTAPVTGQSFIEKMAKHARKKAKQEAEERTQEQIDKQIEKAFDNIEKKYTKEEKKNKSNDGAEVHSQSSNHNEALNDLMGEMGISSTPVKLADRYDFTYSVTMNFKTYAKDGKLESDGDLISYYNSQKNYIAYEFKDGNIKGVNRKEPGVFIMDFDNKATVILGTEDGEKAGIAYGMGDMVSDEELKKAMNEDPEFKKDNDDIGENNPYLKKTGRTKTVAGYKCDEYTFEDDKISSVFWISKDVDWNNKSMLKSLFTASVYSYASPNGFLMESKTKDKNTGEKTIFRVTDISDNISKDFDISQYNITNLGKIKMQEKQ